MVVRNAEIDGPRKLQQASQVLALTPKLLANDRHAGRHRRRGCLGDHRPQPEPQLRCRQLLIVEKTAKICDHAPIAPELASLTRLGTVASTPPEIGDPVIDQLDTGIGQPQQLPTEKAGDLQRSPALG
jgi:hypothetical protein